MLDPFSKSPLGCDPIRAPCFQYATLTNIILNEPTQLHSDPSRQTLANIAKIRPISRQEPKPSSCSQELIN